MLRIKRKILCWLGFHDVPIWWKEKIPFSEAKCKHCGKHLVDCYPR